MHNCSFCKKPGHNIRTCSESYSQKGDCVVCLQAMYGRRTTRVSSCKHVFCATCLDEWTHENPTCPLCRQPAPPRTRPRHAVIEVTDKGVLYYWFRSSGTPNATQWGLPPQSVTPAGRTHIVLHRGDSWYRYAYDMLIKDPLWWGNWAMNAGMDISSGDIQQLAAHAGGEMEGEVILPYAEVVAIIAEELYGASIADDGATPVTSATSATPMAAELVIPLPATTT